MPRRATGLAIALLTVLVEGGLASTLRGGSDVRGAAWTPGPTDSVPTVSVTSPNGGESWAAGTLHNITWTSANDTTDSISYSTDNGSTWLFLARQHPPTHTHYWTVPNTPSTNCLVKVTAIESVAVEDQSDSAFTIAPPDTGFVPQPSIPDGPQHKTVKAGGCIAADPATGDVYLLKGNSTAEFYRYDAARDTWYTGDSIPALDPNGRKQVVKKGASMVVAGGKVYVIKNNKSTELWRYDPGTFGLGGWSAYLSIVSLQDATRTTDGTYDYKLGIDPDTHPRVLKFTRTEYSTGVTKDLAVPSGNPSGKAYKTGCIVYYPDDQLSGHPCIYALQLNISTNEFYRYDIGNGNWAYLYADMPKVWPGTTHPTKKAKANAGAGMAYAAVGNTIYALTGNNTLWVWSYAPKANAWSASVQVPAGSGHPVKKVGKGGGITYSSGTLYVAKGNNSNEYYSTTVSLWKDLALTPGAGAQSVGSNPGPAFGLAVEPNPSNSSLNSSISYSLPRAGNVSLKLYDITGKLLGTLVNGYRPAGPYSYSLLAAHHSLASGVYLLKLESDGRSATSRLVIE